MSFDDREWKQGENILDAQIIGKMIGERKYQLLLLQLTKNTEFAWSWSQIRSPERTEILVGK